MPNNRIIDGRRSPEYSDEYVDPRGLKRSLKSENPDRGGSFSARDFIKILNQLNVPGPLSLKSHLRKENEIHSGRQFTVYEGEVTHFADPVRWNLSSVAVKRCHVDSKDQESFDLTSPKVQKQVHDMTLEVRALGRTKLRQHRNIVNLLGWALEVENTAMPILIMERAIGTLVRLLSRLDSDSDEWNVKHHVCLDMSAGLDAIHKEGIVHADLKPTNILIFQTSRSQVQYIAKLADFGFSVTDTSEEVMNVAGFTKGWEAPEISRCRTPWQTLTAEDYRKADNYSLGLVVWSLICFRGGAPPPDDNIAHSIDAIPSIPEHFSRLVIHAIQSVLLPELCDRPTTVAELFHDESDAYQAW